MGCEHYYQVDQEELDLVLPDRQEGIDDALLVAYLDSHDITACGRSSCLNL
jgi:hypothetical protein